MVGSLGGDLNGGGVFSCVVAAETTWLAQQTVLDCLSHLGPRFRRVHCEMVDLSCVRKDEVSTKHVRHFVLKRFRLFAHWPR